MTWGAVLLLAAGAYAFKAAGMLTSRARLPERLDRVVAIVPAALLPALAALGTVADGRALVLDARSAGLAAALALALARAPFVVVLVAAAGVTAALRAVAG